MSQVEVFTDGGARGNPGPAAAVAVITGLADNPRLICGKYLGVSTNNVAEYSAVLLAYDTILGQKLNPGEVILNFFTDSLLVAKQLSGTYRIKNPNLASYIDQIKERERLFARVRYTHVPREQNKLADYEVNRILDQQLQK